MLQMYDAIIHPIALFLLERNDKQHRNSKPNVHSEASKSQKPGWIFKQSVC